MSFRKWRLLAVPCLLAVVTAAFLRHDIFPVPVRRMIGSTQLTPSLAAISGALIIAGAILVLTALFGRVYCSLLCPAGLLQELFHRLGGLFRIRRLRSARPSPAGPLLVLVALAAITGLMAPVNFLDPLGLFGRLALAVEHRPGAFVPALLLASGGFLLIVLPLFRGRYFCDRLCPAGALMTLIARAVPGRRVYLDGPACVACGRCEDHCPVRAIDVGKKRVDAGRCLVCLGCVDACPTRAISYRNVDGGEQRRSFLRSSAVLAAGGLYVFSRPIAGVFGPAPGRSILPPGAGDDARHRSRCVSCQLCVAACPVGIIRTERMDLRPGLDFNHGFCQYGCTLCSVSCPAGALLPLSLEEKQHTRLARTRFHPERCVAIARNMACGACAEVCPTHAVRMVERGEGLATAPDFDPEYCIGCGACYHVCPVDPRAFVLTGLAAQERTGGVRPGGHAPAGGPLPVREDGELEDFPF